MTALEDAVAGQSISVRLADVTEGDRVQERSRVAHNQNKLQNLEHRLSSVHLRKEMHVKANV